MPYLTYLILHFYPDLFLLEHGKKTSFPRLFVQCIHRVRCLMHT